jgi:hypothetical protein
MVSQSIQAAFLLPPSKALPKLSPMVSCLSRSYFARRPVRPRFGPAPPMARQTKREPKHRR